MPDLADLFDKLAAALVADAEQRRAEPAKRRRRKAGREKGRAAKQARKRNRLRP